MRGVGAWCAAAPLALLGYFVAWGFPPGLVAPDQALLVIACIAWFAYSYLAAFVAVNAELHLVNLAARHPKSDTE